MADKNVVLRTLHNLTALQHEDQSHTMQLHAAADDPDAARVILRTLYNLRAVRHDDGSHTLAVSIEGGVGSDGIQGIEGGPGVTVDDTDPRYPRISVSADLGAGDVVGPNGATDGELPVFDGDSGKLLSSGGVSLALVLDWIFGNPRYTEISQMLTSVTYSGASYGRVKVGGYVEAGGHRYKVLAADSADYDLVGANGVRLDLMPSSAGHYNFAGMNPAADGVTDDYPKLKRLLNKPNNQGTLTPIHFPNGRYFMGQSIQLKKSVRIFGNSSGQPWDNAATLVFPVNSWGIIVHRWNTINNEIEAVPSGGADASIIEGLILQGNGGEDKTKHGIWLRARAIVRNVLIKNFAGAGFAPIAASDGGPDLIGNCNNWVFEYSRVENCEHGIYVRGYDANAGYANMIDCTECRRWGVWDASFLGNSFNAIHTAHNGMQSEKSAFTTFDGKYWHANPFNTEESYVSTQPGTNGDVWRECSPAGGAIAWVEGLPAGTFRSGGGYYSDNVNARSLFTGCYSEGGEGLTWLSQHSMAVGGFLLESPLTTGTHLQSQFDTLLMPNPIRVRRTNPNTGVWVDASLGGDINSDAFLEMKSSRGGEWRLKATGTAGLILDDANGPSPFEIFGYLHPKYPHKLEFSSGFILGSGGTAHHFKPATWTTADGTIVPTEGTYYRGDKVVSPFLGAGDYWGVVCTVAGEAGSTAVFKKFAQVEN